MSVLEEQTDVDFTDRDRLAAAFADLRERGYHADPTLAYRACCRDCALRTMATKVEPDDEDDDGEVVTLPDKFVFWFIQKDDWSFVGSTQGFPLPLQYVDMDEEALEAISDEVDAVIASERLSKYPNLVHHLNLHWCGNADEIVHVLRSHGLMCAVPNSDHWCIEVSPQGSK